MWGRRGRDLILDMGAEMLPYTLENRADERRMILMSLCIAVAIHVAFAFVRLPDIRRNVWLDDTHQVLVVRKYTPPPPRIERPARAAVVRKRVRIMPVPDPTPDEIEPLREPAPMFADQPVAHDEVDFLIGDPEPPPPTQPLMAGIGGVTSPTLIAESKVHPLYPEIARKARIESRVVLQGIIDRDGIVKELEVLQCGYPGIGFEESAKDAVFLWRYEPAMLDGRAVTVYFTVIVDFELT